MAEVSKLEMNRAKRLEAGRRLNVLLPLNLVKNIVSLRDQLSSQVRLHVHLELSRLDVLSAVSIDDLKMLELGENSYNVPWLDREV